MLNTESTKVFYLTTLAMIAFAANSVLCRLALGEQTIDAASFTIIRLLSGAITLFVLVQLRHRKATKTAKGSWGASLMLFVYAVFFSYSYLELDTGTGALILFGVVQITIILYSMIKGNRLTALEWVGTVSAFCGFAYLMSPGVSAPSFNGFLLMAVAGIAWGGYTLLGKGSTQPLADTAYNFIRTTPLIAILLVATIANADISRDGIILAILSGSIASGIGYSIWYAALSSLSRTLSAVVQLSVPLIAAIGGVLFVNEEISFRLMLSTLFILGGIFLVVIGKRKQ